MDTSLESMTRQRNHFNVAIVEDDAANAEALMNWVRKMGHESVLFSSGEAFIASDTAVVDLVLLDWGLPDVLGIEVLRRLRLTAGHEVPVIFCTARNAEKDIADALGAGADDFITKPLRFGEVEARINAVLRRAYPSRTEAARLVFPPYEVDLLKREIRVDGTAVDLQHREYALAALLFQNVNGVVTRNRILQSIWGGRATENSRTLDTHISRVRKKLDIGPARGWQLQTLYGLGYRLQPAATIAAEEPDYRPALGEMVS